MNPALPRALRTASALLAVLLLASCAGAPKKHGKAGGETVAGKPSSSKAHAGTSPAGGCVGGSPYAAAQEDPSTRGDYKAGGLYKPGVKDTTPDHVPDVSCIPEPLVTDEPRSALGNRSPYSVLGKQYYVLDRPRGYVEQGTASYYGAKFHGRRTSNQEVYDMYAFTAAHKTLPLPSFARVTNLDNGQSVVVRINDRGPFHDGRVIDLSYAAAVKLGIVARGTGRVEVRALTPGDRDVPRVAAAPAAAPAASRTATAAAPITVAALPATGLDNLVQALPPVAQPGRDAAAIPASTASMAGAAVAGMDAAGVPQAPPQRFLATTSQSGSYAPAVTPPGAGLAAMAAPSGPAAGATSGPVTGAAVGPGPVAAASAAVPAPGLVTAVPTANAGAGAGPVLQVASFSNLDNARRALERLLAAGIAGARLDDVVADGRTLWRLRVASGGADAAELAGRIAGLGFGTPQLVRE